MESFNIFINKIPKKDRIYFRTLNNSLMIIRNSLSTLIADGENDYCENPFVIRFLMEWFCKLKRNGVNYNLDFDLPKDFEGIALEATTRKRPDFVLHLSQEDRINNGNNQIIVGEVKVTNNKKYHDYLIDLYKLKYCTNADVEWHFNYGIFLLAGSDWNDFISDYPETETAIKKRMSKTSFTLNNGQKEKYTIKKLMKALRDRSRDSGKMIWITLENEEIRYAFIEDLFNDV